MNINSSDNGGRRKKAERRQFSYSFHIPERRKVVDRRNGADRRRAIRQPDELFAMTAKKLASMDKVKYS